MSHNQAFFEPAAITPEPLVEGRAIIGRSETIERRGMIIQSGETLCKRRMLARSRGRVRQDGSRLG